MLGVRLFQQTTTRSIHQGVVTILASSSRSCFSTVSIPPCLQFRGGLDAALFTRPRLMLRPLLGTFETKRNTGTSTLSKSIHTLDTDDLDAANDMNDEKTKQLLITRLKQLGVEDYNDKLDCWKLAVRIHYLERNQKMPKLRKVRIRTRKLTRLQLQERLQQVGLDTDGDKKELRGRWRQVLLEEKEGVQMEYLQQILAQRGQDALGTKVQLEQRLVQAVLTKPNGKRSKRSKGTSTSFAKG